MGDFNPRIPPPIPPGDSGGPPVDPIDPMAASPAGPNNPLAPRGAAGPVPMPPVGGNGIDSPGGRPISDPMKARPRNYGMPQWDGGGISKPQEYLGPPVRSGGDGMPPGPMGFSGGLAANNSGRMTGAVNQQREFAAPRIPPMGGGTNEWYGKTAPQNNNGSFTPPPSAGLGKPAVTRGRQSIINNWPKR